MAPLLHTLVALAGIAGYVTLTALGHDGNEVLVAALGYASGAVIQKGSGGP